MSPPVPLLSALAHAGEDMVLADDAQAVARVVRLATGASTPADHEFVAKAAKVWIESDGAIPWERCMRLPTTTDAFRCMHRDLWLCMAAKCLDAKMNSWGASALLAREWATFISRGPWRDWRDDPAPPEWATPLNRALFHASRFNRGNSLGDRQVHRITRHVFDSKSHSHVHTL